MLCDSQAAKATCPGWVSSSLTGKALYKQVHEMLSLQHATELRSIGNQILGLKAKPPGLEKSRAGAALIASSGLLPVDFRPTIAALIELALCVSDLGSDGLASAPAYTEAAKKVSGAMKTLSDVETSKFTEGLGFEASVLNAWLQEAEQAMKKCQASLTMQYIDALRKVTDACTALTVVVPDPANAEKPFLTYMRNKGGAINRAMKEVRIIYTLHRIYIS